MTKKKTTANNKPISEDDLKYTVQVTVKNDISGEDFMDDCPNRQTHVFKSMYRTEAKFKQAVRRAVKDWIASEPDSFATSVTENGTDDLEVYPGERGYRSAAAKVDVNWNMVYFDMPDYIALRNGFAPAEVISFSANEYDKV